MPTSHEVKPLSNLLPKNVKILYCEDYPEKFTHICYY